MLKAIAILLLTLIAAVLIYASTRPDHFRVERSITIETTPDKVYPLISNFRHWETWSPWEKIDPQIQRTYSGSDAGKGAVYEWKGNKDIGSGRMEIVDTHSPSRVVIKLDFITPFEAHNQVDFNLVQQGNATVVTQAMYGPAPFASKLMGLVFNMDKMVGDKYEEGLQNLKALSEKRS